MATSPTMLSNSSPRRRLQRVGRISVVVIAAATVHLGPIPAVAAPGTPATADDAAELLAAKARELEKLSEQFDTARDRLERQQAAAHAAAGAAAEASARLATARRQVRGIARSVYARGGLSDLHVMLTSSSATDFVQRASTLHMISRHEGEVLGRAATAADAAAEVNADARKAAEEARGAFDAVAAQERFLQAQINEYRADFDRLSAQEKQASVDVAGGRASRAERTARLPVGPVVAPTQAAQTAVDAALAQLGKPYAWGAAGPESFDCSGLVLFAYRAAGVTLPHSAALQATMGQAVSRAELQPGDLVAFYSPVSHIGIYLGNGQMVHAPTFGDVVKVSSIDAVGSITAMRRIVG